MIIKEIFIDGFGIFNAFSLTSLRKGVNILVGENEAGKSTLLKFLRFTLFGYPRSRDERMAPLRGGKHGGRIKTLLSSGKVAVFERYDGQPVRLSFNGRESNNEARWMQLLGNATSSLFNNVYAFTLDELASMNSLNASGVEDKIFSVGLGLGSTTIGEIEKNLQEKADKIYTSRGRKQIIHDLLHNIEDKKKQIKEIQENLPKYKELTEEIGQLEKEVNELGGQLTELRTGKNKLDNYLKCYESYVSYTKAAEQLDLLPVLKDYPDKGVEKLEKLKEKEEDISDNIDELKDGTADEKGIEALEDEIAGISFNSALLDEGKEVEFLRSNLTNYKTTVKEKEDDERKINKLNGTIKQEIENINSSWNEDKVKGFGDLLVHKTKTEEFKKDFETVRQKKTDLEAEIKAMRLKENAVKVKNVFTVIAAVVLLFSAPAFYYGYPVAGGAAVVAALILFFGKNYSVKKPGSTIAQLQLNELLEQEDQLKKKYEEYLKKELDLSAALSPDAVTDALKAIENLKEKITERDELLKKIEVNRQPFISNFQEKTKSLADLLQNESGGDIEELAKQIIREYDQAKEDAGRKKGLKEELDRKTKKLREAEEKLKEIQLKITQLISSIDAVDEDDFRKKYKDNDRVRELIKEKEEALRTIETIAGIGKKDEVISFLNTHEKEAIEDELQEKENKIKETEDTRTEKANILGEKRNERKRIEGESELAGAMTELESEKQKLVNAYQEWLAAKAALKVLGEVKTRYEQEKQPAVIKNSGYYFQAITGGRYPKVQVALGETEVSVYDEHEAVKKLNQLSRGTKEQLLISLRLGFIEEYEKQSEPLPVIVDEVLVNFDPGRARQTADILNDFGKDRQILVFTCHPSTAEIFKEKNIIKI
ncbi:MAG TPA: hypothetical protein ENH02_01610 [Bacteroidetes bacterium]|nr:hypothetical protein [Bacteroidota bacterium]